MKFLLLWFFDRPWVSAALLVVLTLVLGVEARRLQLDPSAEGLMLEKDPARAFYEQVKTRFGSDNLTVVLVKADDVFQPAVLDAVKRLSEGLAGIGGVTRVESLTTVKNIKGEGDALNTEPFFTGAVPQDPETLARIRRDALGNRVFVGNIVSADARATAITVYVDPPSRDQEFNRRFTDGVEALIRKASAPGLTIFQFGSILTQLENARYIEGDQNLMTPIAAVVQLTVLFVLFRTPQGMVIPVATTLISILWGLGLMALARLPLNLLTSIVPALLIAVGFAEDVHMVSEYHERLQRGMDKLAAIRSMLAEAALPLTITTATTVVGFGSLIFTDVTMLRQFGKAASLGLIANFFVTMLLAPLMLRLWPVPRRFRPSALVEGVRDTRLDRFL